MKGQTRSNLDEAYNSQHSNMLPMFLQHHGLLVVFLSNRFLLDRHTKMTRTILECFRELRGEDSPSHAYYSNKEDVRVDRMSPCATRSPWSCNSGLAEAACREGSSFRGIFEIIAQHPIYVGSTAATFRMPLRIRHKGAPRIPQLVMRAAGCGKPSVTLFSHPLVRLAHGVVVEEAGRGFMLCSTWHARTMLPASGGRCYSTRSWGK